MKNIRIHSQRKRNTMIKLLPTTSVIRRSKYRQKLR